MASKKVWRRGRRDTFLQLGWAAVCLWAAAGGVIAWAHAASPAKTRTLQVFAAASLMDAFTELGHKLEAREPGLRVRFNFSGSQQLAIQLEQGATADVFASADERWMSYAAERGLLEDSSRVFARNPLVVILPRTNPARIQELQDLARPGVKLVIGADAVPVGRYSRMALQSLARDRSYSGDYATRVLKNVVSEEENVKSVVGKVQLGEADAGFAYRSDVTPAVSRFLRVLTLPEGAQIVASYPIAALRSSTDPAAAQAFLDLVLSSEGQQVLQRRGLLPATDSKR